ncbi:MULTISPECIES: trypsin-like serine peptidase [Anoxybacillaceae]|jgi:glutamyl endopeptidase|uniref:Serine protease n=5 Tax=Anoxybacillaceae TaxID=3120669 RepID=A0AAN1D8Q0_PARTM|nr:MULTISPECIES: trypsin-like serine protease [Bacillaceae]ANZ32296.1 glutamyl endopeptidase [Parageobacillus thermoglucosidasius]APM83031.1 glutamyl endopeptidase [Parageobacillus thermoglucosidasius]ARP44586.1 Glutamyl endopeptidase [Geobacillus thermodenitrificans]KJX67611.1 glutamyl endopeptidase [Parageobacillus thermoglucosidasius]KQB92902.1 glutamyl-endopeptidase [Geobacillus sp. PA-3]
MKKIGFIILVMVGFIISPIINAPETVNAQKNSNNAYDMINSKGEVIKYEDYIKKLKNSKSLVTEGSEGTGEVLPKTEINTDFKKNKPYKYNLTPETTYIGGKSPNEYFPQVVIGADGRTKVSNTSVTPHRQIAYIELEFRDGWYTCTGTVIGKDKVLTNAHCVMDVTNQSGAINGYVYPAVNNNTYSYGVYQIVDYYITSNYVQTGDPTQDFAVLKLSTYLGKNIGDVVGYLPLRQVSSIQGTSAKLYGYPGDKIEQYNEVSQWGMTGSISKETNELAFYQIDTYNGQSGSSLLNSSNEIIAVHRGSFSVNGTTYNGGPKMIKPVYDFIRAAMLN